jgi:hypothetical protein
MDTEPFSKLAAYVSKDCNTLEERFTIQPHDLAMILPIPDDVIRCLFPHSRWIDTTRFDKRLPLS